MVLTFKIIMVLTFIATIATLAMGVGAMGKGKDSNPFMRARVFLSLLLLGEILIFISFIR